MRLYVDGLAVYHSVTNEINQFIGMPQGEHTIEVTAVDCGLHRHRDSTGQCGFAGTRISNIWNLPNWRSCSSHSDSRDQRALRA